MTDPNQPHDQGPSFEKQPRPEFPAAPPPPPGEPPANPPGAALALPPGVELASHGRRIGAYFLAIVLWIVTLVIGYIVWGIIAWRRGTSPALQVLGMRCWTINERRVPGFWRMVLRDVVGGIVQGILGIITGVISFVLFLVTPNRQSVPDMIAGTTVVYDPRKVLG